MLVDYERQNFSEAWALIKQMTYKDTKATVSELIQYGDAAARVRAILQKNPPWLKENIGELALLKRWCHVGYPNFLRQFDQMGITVTYQRLINI
jgi:hypothetical protein